MRALSLIWELRSSIFASPKILEGRVSGVGRERGGGRGEVHPGVA